MSASPHVLIVEARFYENITDQLVAGATSVLEKNGAVCSRQSVPGAFELPAAIAFAARFAERMDAISFAGFVALGCVIRGETDHYDHICRETSRALMDLAVDRGIALGFGLLTCHSYEQARVRASVEGKNKGADAARACLRMMELKRVLGLV